ncbi:MAG: class II aldolase/adducin family protein [Acidimicrobiia bacterium]|nr:class II aldolase/adducin family protein [Acidimicrobiia bacterium]
MTYAPFSPSDVEQFFDDPVAERARRREQLAQAYRLFGALKYGDLGDGHISIRDPERTNHFWLLRYGVSFHAAAATDTVLVAPDGSTVDEAAIGASPAPINISAYHIHHPIHEARPDVAAAAHVHTPWGTAFSTERRLIEPINQEATQFFETHALFDDEEVQVLSTEGGKRIAVALGDKRSIILANHGLLTTGRSVADALGWLVTMERACEVQLKANNPVRLSDDATRIARADLVSDHVGWQTFQYLIRRHL